MSRGRDLFLKFKPVFRILSSVCSIFPLSIRKKLFEGKRYSRGLYGIGIRYVLLKSIAKQCGDNVMIGEGCFILNPESLSIGNNVSIQPMCYFDAAGGIEIGNDVSIAHSSTIMSTTHNYTETAIPIKDQGVIPLSVSIEDNVWIGAKVTILGGNTVRTGCVVGAGSVVTKDTDRNTVYVGVPAKKIKDR